MQKLVKAALSQTASSWTTSPSLTHLLSTIQEPAAEIGSSGRGSVPPQLMQRVLSSFCPSVGIILFMASAAPSHLSSRLFFSEPLLEPLPLCLLPSPLPFSLSAGACQSLLMTNSFAGALNSANYFSYPSSLSPFRSLFSFFFSFFLVPVTPLIERAALRPGNECKSQFKTSAVQQRSAACAASNSGSQELNVLTLEALQRRLARLPPRGR